MRRRLDCSAPICWSSQERICLVHRRNWPAMLNPFGRLKASACPGRYLSLRYSRFRTSPARSCSLIRNMSVQPRRHQRSANRPDSPPCRDGHATAGVIVACHTTSPIGRVTVKRRFFPARPSLSSVCASTLWPSLCPIVISSSSTPLPWFEQANMTLSSSISSDSSPAERGSPKTLLSRYCHVFQTLWPLCFCAKLGRGTLSQPFPRRDFSAARKSNRSEAGGAFLRSRYKSCVSDAWTETETHEIWLHSTDESALKRDGEGDNAMRGFQNRMALYQALRP